MIFFTPFPNPSLNLIDVLKQLQFQIVFHRISDPLFFPGGRPAVGGFSVTRMQPSRSWSVWVLEGTQKVTSLLCKDFTSLYTFSESLVAPFSKRSLNRGAAVISE